MKLELMRLNELSKEVENFLKKNSTKNNKGTYSVDKDLFLESIVDVQHSTDKNGDIVFKYNFLNERINKKYYQTHNRLKDLTTMEDFFSDVSYKIVSVLKDKDEVEINFDDYKNTKDDISEIVFLIDTECHREVLEVNDIKLNRSKDDDKAFQGGYWKPFGDLIFIDEENDDGTLVFEEIGLDDVIGHTKDDSTEEEINELIDSFKLTNRQKEVLHELLRHNGNRSQTAKSLEISESGLYKTISKIQERTIKNFGYSSIYDYETKSKKPIDQLDDILDSDFKDIQLVNFIKKNIDDKDINELVYGVDVEVRKPFIFYVKDNTPMFTKEINHFLVSFLSQYYQLNR